MISIAIILNVTVAITIKITITACIPLRLDYTEMTAWLTKVLRVSKYLSYYLIHKGMQYIELKMNNMAIMQY